MLLQQKWKMEKDELMYQLQDANHTISSNKEEADLMEETLKE